jgi:transcriptional regulator
VAIDKTYIVLKQLKIRIAESLPDFRVDIKKNDTGEISFIYKGNFSKADEVNIKVAKSSEVILKIIEENPGFTKDDIKGKVGGQIGQMAVNACLLDLEKKNIIFSKTQKPKTYFIKEEISTLF